MKIIFLKDVLPHGKKDEIKEVKDGFGKYLISTNVAVLYTNKSNEILNNTIKEREKKEESIIKEATKLKEKLEKITLKFKVNTSNNDKVFGNVSSKQIAEELKKLGYNIDKKKIKNNDLNVLGYHDIEIELHKKVNCFLKIHLEK